jgi:hypothetical protein
MIILAQSKKKKRLPADPLKAPFDAKWDEFIGKFKVLGDPVVQKKTKEQFRWVADSAQTKVVLGYYLMVNLRLVFQQEPRNTYRMTATLEAGLGPPGRVVMVSFWEDDAFAPDPAELDSGGLTVQRMAAAAKDLSNSLKAFVAVLEQPGFPQPTGAALQPPVPGMSGMGCKLGFSGGEVAGASFGWNVFLNLWPLASGQVEATVDNVKYRTEPDKVGPFLEERMKLRKATVDKLGPLASQVGAMLVKGNIDVGADFYVVSHAVEADMSSVGGWDATIFHVIVRILDVDPKIECEITYIGKEKGRGVQSLLGPMAADKVSPDLIEDGLRANFAIKGKQFEAKSEAARGAIEMVNKEDLLGAIQAMESATWAKMETDPTFYQKYLEAVRRASQGDAAWVAEFVNSLGSVA